MAKSENSQKLQKTKKNQEKPRKNKKTQGKTKKNQGPPKKLQKPLKITKKANLGGPGDGGEFSDLAICSQAFYRTCPWIFPQNIADSSC